MKFPSLPYLTELENAQNEDRPLGGGEMATKTTMHLFFNFFFIILQVAILLGEVPSRTNSNRI